MNAPFFSVIIPTKNRSHVLSFAIQSVLNQTFDDFEIIVSDNDDSEILTREAVKAFFDPRIRYFRTTGTLSMPDNWQFGLDQAKGQYITVLEDKQVLYPDGLASMHSILSETGAAVLTWDGDHLDDTYNPPELIKFYGSGKVSTQASEEMLAGYARRLINYRLPRMINSCVKRSVVDYIQRETPLRRFFIPVCPDLSAAFIQLNYVNEIIHIDRSFFIWAAASLSAGRAIRLKTDVGRRSIEDIRDPGLYYDYVPIKSISLTNNFAINDYRRLRNLLGGRLSRYPISHHTYLVAVYKDILRSIKLGVDMTEEKDQWKDYFRSQRSNLKLKVSLYILKFLLKEAFKKFSSDLLGRGLVSRLARNRRVIPTSANPLQIALSRSKRVCDIT